ncbi:hypothetical protein HDV00_001804 [Rhizophlyctis rosea]|nr:hypothetical protein HDV00_001804 [Rhizophlyctis rosea]
MSTHYKLLYFPLRGRAETARMILAAGDADWQNEFIQWGPDWDGRKDGTPFGHIPILEEYTSPTATEPPFRVAETHAVERYLARKFGFVGNDEKEAAVIDSVAESIFELHTAFYMYTRGASAAEKPTLREKFNTTMLPTFYKFHSRILEKNGNSGHYVGSKLSYADIYLFAMLESYTFVEGSDALEAYPVFKKVMETVMRCDGIRKYVESDGRVGIYPPKART